MKITSFVRFQALPDAIGGFVYKSSFTMDGGKIELPLLKAAQSVTFYKK